MFEINEAWQYGCVISMDSKSKKIKGQFVKFDLFLVGERMFQFVTILQE